MKILSPLNCQLQQLIPKVLNKTELQGNWNELKGILKQKIASLTKNGLLYKEGKQDEMYGKLQIKLGKNRSRIANNYH